MNMISSENKLLITDQNEEVKKLQDLVKKLELQNVELRRKRCVNEFNSEQQKLDRRSCNIHNISANCDDFKKHGSISLDSIDIIDVQELEELSDEDTWLFSPPRELTPEQRKLSPYKWLRTDIDNPKDVEIQSVRKALVDKLDEIIRISPFTTPNNPSIPSSAHSVEQSKLYEDNKINNVPPNSSATHQAPLSDNHVPNFKAPISYRGIDSRTFTRPKKRKELFPVEKTNNNNIAYNHENDSPVERLQDEETPSEFDDLCSIESSMTASGLYKFHGVQEVQELARMQEESLRQSSSPVSSPKHSSGSSSREHLSYHVTEDGMYVNHVNVGEYAHSCKSSGFNDEESDSFDLSAHSSPSESSNMPAYHSRRKSEDSLRRSLPNLRKGYNAPEIQKLKNARHPSESRLQYQLGDNSASSVNSGISGLKLPNTVRRDSHPLPVPQAVSSLRAKSASQTCNSSVSKKNLTREVKLPQYINSPSTNGQSRSSLPKPSSRLPTPKARSGLPVPSSRLPQRSPQAKYDDKNIEV